jgi:glycerophosphoryl diester phosphodiesterase
MKVIGHRGARGLAPENTLASFKKALEHHVDEIEFDVRVTKDHIPVIHHDPKLSDPAGNDLVINHYTLEELRTHKPDLPTLSETLTALTNRCPMLMEIKSGEPVNPIAAVLRSHIASGLKPKDIAVGSFDQSILVAMHREFPDLALVVNERWSGVRAHYRAKQLGTHRLNMRSWWLWSGFIKGMSRRGYHLAAYTLNDPKKARQWEKYGLYAVTTDYPDRFEHKT